MRRRLNHASSQSGMPEMLVYKACSLTNENHQRHVHATSKKAALPVSPLLKALLSVEESGRIDTLAEVSLR